MNEEQTTTDMTVAEAEQLSAPIYPGPTYGQKAVGLTFNPSGDPRVQRVKELYASVIDGLADLRAGNPGEDASAEVKRLASIAITEAQTAQMWAVKAFTWKD